MSERTIDHLPTQTKTRGLRPTLEWALHRVWLRWRSAAALAIAFRLLQVILLAPLIAGVLRLFLLRWGRASVGNFEIAAFFLSPTGIAALLCVGALIVATEYLEISGLIRILASDRLPWWRALRSSTGILHRLVYLGLRQLAVYLVLATPFLAGIGLVYWWLWSGRDLNGLVILKPPRFWWGVGLAGLLLTAYLIVAARWFFRWLYSVPILCLEGNISIPAALRLSERRAQGSFAIAVTALAIWFAVNSVLGLIVLGALRWMFLTLLDRPGESLTTASMMGGFAVIVHAAASGGLAILSSLTLSAVVLGLYRHVSADDHAKITQPSAAEVDSPAWHGWLWTGLVAFLALLALASGSGFIFSLPLRDPVEITAHRAGGARGPENSVAALKQAIVDGADWAEIDVQLTADNELVVMHDIDLARVGGGARRVDAATLAEIRELDIGTSFGPAFAGERIPTFAEMLTTARGKIRLNVELKPHGRRDETPLTERVIGEIRAAGMVDQCRICSQSYESIQLAKQLEPKLAIGFIVATSLGDSARLPVDFLMIKSGLASPTFVERAHAADIRIHAWTVNSPDHVARLVDAGVDNIITDDVILIRKRLDEIAVLSPVERLLLRVRNLLAR
jgi:glycerophosphoryl diester phosphodiesterase